MCIENAGINIFSMGCQECTVYFVRGSFSDGSTFDRTVRVQLQFETPAADSLGIVNPVPTSYCGRA